MKLYEINIPSHLYGRSFQFDFPVSSVDESVTGCMCYAVGVVYNGYGANDAITKTFAKVSISTDQQNIIYPSYPLAKLPIKATANQLMQPVDFVKVGNRLCVVLEEFDNPELFGQKIEYTLKVYLKTYKKVAI